VISYGTYGRIKLFLWLLIQSLFFVLFPVCLSLYVLSTGEIDSFCTLWVFIDTIYCVALIAKYAVKYDSSFWTIVWYSNDDAFGQQGKEPSQIEDGSRLVSFEPSIYSLVVAIQQRDEYLIDNVVEHTQQWKQGKSVLSNFEVAEVYGTAVFTLIC